MENINYTKIDEMTEEEQQKLLGKAMDEETQKNFYTKMRKKIDDYIKKHPNSKYINYLVAAPDFFYLLCKLLGDSRTPLKNKVYIAAAITYFVSPIDILSDLIPGVGLVDDVIIVVNILNSLINSVDESVLRENWPGSGDVMDQIKQLLDMADTVVGKNIWGKIKKFFTGK